MTRLSNLGKCNNNDTGLAGVSVVDNERTTSGVFVVGLIGGAIGKDRKTTTGVFVDSTGNLQTLIFGRYKLKLEKIMSTWLLRSAAPAVLSFLAFSAQAGPLPVTNLQFNVFNAGSSFTTPPIYTPKDYFTDVNPTNWSVGTAGAGGSLTYVGQQGSEGVTGPRPLSNVYPVYTNPGFSVTVPAGTNFFQADGNPEFENTIFQTVSGLTANTTYTLQFQQAAGQQVGFSGQTTEQWKVFLGDGNIGVDCSTDPCTVTGTTGDIEMDSPLMTTASQQNTDWNNVVLSFTPTAANLGAGGTAVLTFLAWGDGGSTTNLPPTVFLEGVNTTPTVPEPATLSLFGLGLVGLGARSLRRPGKRTMDA